MAYLKPTSLKCSVCSFVAQIDVVVGVGPASQKGDTPYRRYRAPGTCVEGKHSNGSKDGTLRCPEDGTLLWTNAAGTKADQQ